MVSVHYKPISGDLDEFSLEIVPEDQNLVSPNAQALTEVQNMIAAVISETAIRMHKEPLSMWNHCKSYIPLLIMMQQMKETLFKESHADDEESTMGGNEGD